MHADYIRGREEECHEGHVEAVCRYDRDAVEILKRLGRHAATAVSTRTKGAESAKHT